MSGSSVRWWATTAFPQGGREQNPSQVPAGLPEGNRRCVGRPREALALLKIFKMDPDRWERESGRARRAGPVPWIKARMEWKFLSGGRGGSARLGNSAGLGETASLRTS